MSNPIFRARAISHVSAAITESESAALLDQSALCGRVREIALNNLIKPFLPSAFEVGTGKIADSRGFQSRETDLVIYSKAVLPPVLYSERDGVFPVEASFYAIEVKPRVTSDELDDAIAKARELRKLTYTMGEYDAAGKPSPHTFLPIIPALFGFCSDLAPGGKSDLERYFERDSEAASSPCIAVICIAGRGYWWFEAVDKHWRFHSPTPEWDEVIDFMSGVINTLPDSLVARRRPRLGLYLMAR